MTATTTEPRTVPPGWHARRLRYRELGTAELPHFALRDGECAVLWRGDGWWVWWCEHVVGSPEGLCVHACPVTTEGFGSAERPLLEGVMGAPDAWESVELGIRICGVPAHAPWR